MSNLNPQQFVAYHATQRIDWDKNMPEVMHVGSRRSAFDRIRTLEGMGHEDEDTAGNPWHVYEVEVASEKPFPRTMDDAYVNTSPHSSGLWKGLYDSMAYKNETEDIGSVSHLVRREAVTVRRVRRVTRPSR